MKNLSGTITHYTRTNNSYFVRYFYPSGRDSKKIRISKNDFIKAKEEAEQKKDTLLDLVIDENELYYTEK